MADQVVDHRRAIAERNVEAILDAAERLLERREPTTISAVAVEAGVSRPTVYAHFPDRERLLRAVVQRSVRRWIGATEQIEPGRGPAREALDRLIELSWEEISRSSHIAAMASSELAAESVREAHEEGAKLLRRLVARGRRDGSFRTDVPTDWLVSAFFALIHAAHEDVRSGRLDSRKALQALARTVPDLFGRRD